MSKYITLVEGNLVCNIPKGMTNGEVIQALFPEVKVEINGFLVRCVFVEHEFTTPLDWWNASYTLLDWWNTPYKADREVSE